MAIESKIGPGIYFVDEKKPKASFDIFASTLSESGRGICITREPPEQVQKEWSFPNTTFYWLALRKSKGTVPAKNLRKLVRLIDDATREGRTVVLLDGIEFLITMNGYSRVMSSLEKLNNRLEGRSTTVIIPIDCRTLHQQELKEIENCFMLIRAADDTRPESADLSI